ncbi:MAG TPA: B12-binding domain-containing radical SAM protein [Clostridia bacterium]|nr:B12-binding domain-containing radical SAM protein [Clostridia bacterium]
MKTVIVSLNSKYIHSSLAPWYLKAFCNEECGIIRIREFTINENPDTVLSSIFLEQADAVAFSCYIWNITYVLKVAEDLKKISPETVIILGGPEVSYDPDVLLAEKHYIDFIISGEGERPFKSLLNFLSGKRADADLFGITYRSGASIIKSAMPQLIENLDSIPSPYTEEMLDSLNGRIVYFESSRGCPFSCSYCISSTFEGVRYFSIERVRSDLHKLINAGVKQIKFVDRTFNCNKKRAIEIFKFISEDQSEVNFHFEAAADLFDDEMLQVLSSIKPGKIQLEIGIQSTNESVHKAVARKTNIQKVLDSISALVAFRNMHIHVDLIAGLPFEDYESFKNSFNQVYGLKSDNLQLGFLKMLKGSRIREEADFHGYKFKSCPPYEVLENRYISYREMLELKGIEELVERYYNSGRFVSSLNYLIKGSKLTAYDFFRSFLVYDEKNVHSLERSLSSRELYKVLLDFTDSVISEAVNREFLNELLKYDFLLSDNSNNLPNGILREMEPGFKDRCFEFLKNEANIGAFLPQFKGIAAKQVFKAVHFERFKYDILQSSFLGSKSKVILFNYLFKDKVTGLYESIDITEVFDMII